MLTHFTERASGFLHPPFTILVACRRIARGEGTECYRSPARGGETTGKSIPVPKDLLQFVTIKGNLRDDTL